MINERISGSQFSIIVFLASTNFIFSITNSALNDNIYDSIISTLLAFALGMVLSVPLLLIYKNKIRPDMSSLPAKILSALYILYFAFSVVQDLYSFVSMAQNTVFPDLNTIVFSLGVFVICLYGAFKGIEVLGRAASVVLIIFIVGCLIIMCSSLQLYSPINREVFFYNGFDDFNKNMITIFSKSSFLPQSLVLLMYVNKDAKKLSAKYLSWTIGGAVVCMVFFYICVLTLGNFLSFQQYPVYTISALSSINPLQRLDIIFNVVWVCCICIRISASLFAVLQCLQAFVNVKVARIITVGLSALIVIVVEILSGNTGMIIMPTLISVSFVSIIILGAVIPLSMLCINKIKASKGGKN